MFFHTSFITLFTSFIAVVVSQKCYGLDGTELDNTFAPCNSSAKHSGCCATNRSAGSDICLDNGLCMATRDEYMGSIWQSGCTDPTGKDAACPKMCPDVTNGFDGLNPVPAWNVQMCDYGTYCCRAANDRKNCCNDPAAPKITTKNIGSFQFSTPAASVTTTSVSIPVTTTTSVSTLITTTASVSIPVTTTLPITTVTPINTALPIKNTLLIRSISGLNTEASSSNDLCKKERRETVIVGATVGSVLGAALIGLSGLTLWIHKKERRQRRLKEHYEEQFSQTVAYRKMLASSSGSIMNAGLEIDIGENPREV